MTIVVGDLMSILYRTVVVSINLLMAWWEKSQSCLRLVSRSEGDLVIVERLLTPLLGRIESPSAFLSVGFYPRDGVRL